MLQLDDDDSESRTMVRYPGSSAEETLKATPTDRTLVSPATLESDLGTMVINSDSEDESTMKSEFSKDWSLSETS